MNVRNATALVALVLAHAALGTTAADAQASAPPASTTAPASTGRIRGVAFDSLLMKPIPRAAVQLMGTGRATVTDERGRFSFDSVPAGTGIVALSSPEFDSLGFGTLGAETRVDGRATTEVLISTPSLHSVWLARCATAVLPSADSGLVWGRIRNAATDSAVGGAEALFSWYDVRPGALARLAISESQKGANTNEAGIYVSCGLPTAISISAQAVSTGGVAGGAASGRLQYTIGARRLHRLDVYVSHDMVLADGASAGNAADSVAERPRGRAVLRGTVSDDRHASIPGAVAQLATIDTTVRTNSDGKFQLDGLPGGTHMLHVRSVGRTPVSRLVHLRPDVPAELPIELSSVTTLAAMNVVARSKNRLDYDDRRDRGIGYAIDSTILNHRSDMVSALSNLQFVTVKRSGSGAKVAAFRTCLATFLDGLPSRMDLVTVLPPDHFRAVEVIQIPAMVPPQFMNSAGCGVILFWSKNGRW